MGERELGLLDNDVLPDLGGRTFFSSTGDASENGKDTAAAGAPGTTESGSGAGPGGENGAAGGDAEPRSGDGAAGTPRATGDGAPAGDGQGTPGTTESGSGAGPGGENGAAGGDAETRSGDGAGAGEGAPRMVRVGTEEVAETEVSEGLVALRNKTDWQAAFTQRDQETAALRKAVEPVVALMELLQTKPAVATALREALTAEDAAAGVLLEQALTFDKTKHPNPFQAELEERDARIAEMEGRQALREAETALASKHGLQPHEVQAVTRFAAERYAAGFPMDLEDALKVLRFDQVQAEAKKKSKPAAPAPPKVPAAAAGAGAKDIKTAAAATTVEDVPMPAGLKFWK